MNEIFDFIDNNEKGIMKVIGFDNEKEYNVLLKKLFDLKKEKNIIFFEDRIPFPSNREVISIIQNAANKMNLNIIEKEEINLVTNIELNSLIRKGIDIVLAPYLRSNYFSSKNVKINFFVKTIVWIYEFFSKVNYPKLPKVIYYGEVLEDEKIFLEILGQIGIKTILFKPNGDININSSKELIFDNQFECMSMKDRIKIGEYIESIKSIEKIENIEENKEIQNNSSSKNVIKSEAKEIKDEIMNEFLKSGIFKPWIFRKGYVKSLIVDSVVEDLKTYAREDSRFRPNFKHEGSTVFVPNFFIKVNGTYIDKVKYRELIESIVKNPLVKIIEQPNLINTSTLPMTEVYSLSFVLNESKTEIIKDKLKEHKCYMLKEYNLDVQDLIIKKLNEFYDVYKGFVTPEEFLKLIFIIINLPEEYAILIENFDFPYKVPKLFIYLKERKLLNKENAMLIHFFKLLAFDIIIFSPIGAPYIEDNLFNEHLSIIDLDEMTYSYDYKTAISQKEDIKKSIFKKIFK